MTENRPPNNRDDDRIESGRRKAYDFEMDEEWDVEKFLAQKHETSHEQRTGASPSDRRQESGRRQEPEQGYRRQQAREDYREEPQGYRRPARRQEERRDWEEPQVYRRQPLREDYREEPQGYRRPADRRGAAKRKKKSGNGKLYVILALIVLLLAVLVIWLVSVIRKSGDTEQSAPLSSAVPTEPTETEPQTEAPEVRAAALIQEADVLAAGYDSDAAVAKLEEFGSQEYESGTMDTLRLTLYYALDKLEAAGSDYLVQVYDRLCSSPQAEDQNEFAFIAELLKEAMKK